MKIHFTILFLTFSTLIYSQKVIFPQEKINNFISSKLPSNDVLSTKSIKNNGNKGNGIFKAIEYFNNFNKDFHKIKDGKFYKKSLDTLIIGEVPGDTVIIRGKWNHTGPIYIFNDGVLIFKNAVVNDTGDIYVLGNGKLFADSSSFNFPQKYFYERGLLILQNAKALITNCSFQYSGMSHTLYLAHNADLTMLNVKFKDWTTCGMFGSPKLIINGCNLAGEYILSDKCSATFLNTDTIILWHQIPDKAEIDFVFPNGDFVKNYKFNNSIAGIKGLDYNVKADSCSVVMWALMPVNGSKVKISNSKIRLIGNWFMRGDSALLKGVFNNSHYTDYTIPLYDRTLRLVNSDVQTWSMYVFDSSKLYIDSCVLGEVGSQNKSGIFAINYVCDGSGGYFWATDTSIIFANNVIVYTTVRSERNALVVLANSWLPFSPPSAIHKSILICSQNKLAAPPIPYDQSVVWNIKIDKPDTALNFQLIPITGSAWIKQGPGGNPMKFDSYRLSFRSEKDNKWTYITNKTTSMVDENTLGIWNTKDLLPGLYVLKLTVKDNYGDSVEAFKVVVLEPTLISIGKKIIDNNFSVFPNPAKDILTIQFEKQTENYDISMYNSYGQQIRYFENISDGKLIIYRQNLSNGVYFIRVINSLNESKIIKIILD